MKKNHAMNSSIPPSFDSQTAAPAIGTTAAGVALLFVVIASAMSAVYCAICGGMPLFLYTSLAVCAACLDPLRSRFMAS